MMWKRVQYGLAAVAVALFVAGCGIEVPEDKSDYVGQWVGEDMSLAIEQGGAVSYERKKGSSTTKVNGPIQKFEDDNFVVGIPFLNTTFEVSKSPYEEEGVWKMVVDGVELTKR